MNWYYAENTQRNGPFDQPAFDELVKSGQVTPETLVWREDLPDWKPYREVIAAGPISMAEGDAACAECRRTFPRSEMVSYEGLEICANCKPVFFQRIREGIMPATEMTYAGFWIRFLAKFIDGILLQLVGLLLNFLLTLVLSPTENPTPFLVVNWITSMLISAGYGTYFVGSFGATPGKMACRLRVVRPDGAKMTYPRALGRHFAELLSSLTLGVGYIIAAFDEEKRSLHDRVCDTRVIRLNA